MRSGLPGRNQRELHRQTESRIFKGEFAPQRRRIIRSFRTRSSKSHDRVLPAPGSSEDRHLPSDAEPQKQLSLNPTSAPRGLPPVSAAMLSVARARQVSRRPVAQDHSEEFDRRNSATGMKFREFLLNPASAIKPMHSKPKTPAGTAESIISFSTSLGCQFRPGLYDWRLLRKGKTKR